MSGARRGRPGSEPARASRRGGWAACRPGLRRGLAGGPGIAQAGRGGALRGRCRPRAAAWRRRYGQTRGQPSSRRRSRDARSAVPGAAAPGGALVRAVLAGGVPPAVAQPRTDPERLPAGGRRDARGERGRRGRLHRGAAPCRQLGRRGRLGGRQGLADHYGGRSAQSRKTVRAVPRLPPRPRHGDHPADRWRPPGRRRPGRSAGQGSRGTAARRPGPVGPGRGGRALRRPYPNASRPGDAGAAHRCAAVRDGHVVRARRAVWTPDRAAAAAHRGVVRQPRTPAHPADRRRPGGGHRRPPGRLAHAPAALARRAGAKRRRRPRVVGEAGVRIGIVCPYSFDVPGGVQNHVHDLAQTLIGLGHQVSVLAPADDEEHLPPFVVPAGRAVPVPYNGSVARLAFGPISAARVRRWLTAGRFDVVHVHEPVTPSLSMLAVLYARTPVVATFHTATTRSRAMSAAQGMLQVVLEKITARIAVSDLARRVQVEHLDGGGWEIPNGVAVARFADAVPLPGWPGPGGAVGFLGRFTEPRKGFPILLNALSRLAPARPGLRLLVAGPGDQEEALADRDRAIRDRITFLGKVSDADKARMLRSVDLYVAPNTGGESFGMILTEAMAAGTAVVASDLDAFRRVLDGGRAGVHFPAGDPDALAGTNDRLLDDPAARAELADRAGRVVAGFDWPVVAARVLEVYATAIEAAPRMVADLD